MANPPEFLMAYEVPDILGHKRSKPIPPNIEILWGDERDTENTLWAAAELMLVWDLNADLRLIYAAKLQMTDAEEKELLFANLMLTAEHYYKIQKKVLHSFPFPKSNGMTPADLEALSCLAKQIKNPNMVMVDVGSWMGASAAILGLIAKEQTGVVYAIDFFTWFGDSIFTLFRAAMRKLGLYNGYIRTVLPMAMSSFDAMRIFADNIVDLVFIDANHEYEFVRIDILGWFNKLKPGGILCGHDCDDKHPGVVKALEETVGEYFVMPGTSIWALVKQ